jgi:hypothetical protein
MNTDLPPPMPTLFEPTSFEPTSFKKVGFTHPDEYVAHDTECLKQLQEFDEVNKENKYMPISGEMWVPFDYGFDHEKGDKDRRNRLEEAMAKLEQVLAEEIVVPGCQLARCKRSKDGVRIKAYWAEPESNEYGSNERGRRTENHILLHLCKYTFKEVNVPQLIVLCSKRGGDIFPHLDIVKQLKQKIENK